MASGIYKTVRLLKLFFALLLALAWVPLSLHCQLETLPGLEFLACDSEDESNPHQSSDCADDFCQVIESGHYKTEEQATLLPKPTWTPLPLEAGLNPVASACALTPLSTPTLSPPALAAGWQFSLRTALPVRAPSFAS